MWFRKTLFWQRSLALRFYQRNWGSEWRKADFLTVENDYPLLFSKQTRFLRKSGLLSFVSVLVSDRWHRFVKQFVNLHYQAQSVWFIKPKKKSQHYYTLIHSFPNLTIKYNIYTGWTNQRESVCSVFPGHWGGVSVLVCLSVCAIRQKQGIVWLWAWCCVYLTFPSLTIFPPAPLTGQQRETEFVCVQVCLRLVKVKENWTTSVTWFAS